MNSNNSYSPQKARERETTEKANVALDDKFPDGTTEEDRTCWVCSGETAYRNCKIICKNCGFTRDCSDP